MTFAQAVTLLDTIPGVNQRGSELLVAEWGIDMGRFGTAARLAARSGRAPGNDESAGKQRSGKTRQGNQAWRTDLTQLAHAAARTKGTSWSALYHRLAARPGKKRAIMAVAHSIVVSAFHLLSRREPYRELGADDSNNRRQAHGVDQLTRRIERLGYRVTIEPVAAASLFIFTIGLARHSVLKGMLCYNAESSTWVIAVVGIRTFHGLKTPLHRTALSAEVIPCPIPWLTASDVSRMPTALIWRRHRPRPGLRFPSWGSAPPRAAWKPARRC